MNGLSQDNKRTYSVGLWQGSQGLDWNGQAWVMVLMLDAAQRYHLEGVEKANQRTSVKLSLLLPKGILFEYRIINMSQSGLDALAILSVSDYL